MACELVALEGVKHGFDVPSTNDIFTWSVTFLDAEVRGDALAFRGRLLEEQGQLDDALRDHHAAYALMRQATYSRYVTELGLGGLYEKTGQPASARTWYLAALTTSLQADDVSCGAALRGCLRARGAGPLTQEERALCEGAARRSWNFLAIPGSPDLANLPGVADTLLRAQGRALAPGAGPGLRPP